MQRKRVKFPLIAAYGPLLGFSENCHLNVYLLHKVQILQISEQLSQERTKSSVFKYMHLRI